MPCEILDFDGNSTMMCISSQSAPMNVTIDIRKSSDFSCRWPSHLNGSQYVWKFRAPEHWKILLRIKSDPKRLTLEVERRNDNTFMFKAIEHPHFLAGNEIISRSNVLTMRARIHPELLRLSEGSNQTFNVFVRTVRLKDPVDMQPQGCDVPIPGSKKKYGNTSMVNLGLKLKDVSLLRLMTGLSSTRSSCSPSPTN
ncbi:uncharacterized protein LOC121431243 [Lytechinus variegatus]|uniref:uncharacterized protein LOC121431243 n=1 Tax=Lytechinus variegatus TaxID=7654 RepID=UPI001BB2A91A|nr:uncharacterized protein LOC121431243 [Lytechinus variegatus]